MLRSIFSGRQAAVRRSKKATIAIFCKEMRLGGDPFSSDYYWQAYQDLLLALKRQGLEAYFVSDNNSYSGDGMFSTAYTLDRKTTISKLKVVHDVKVDLVFDRGGFIGRDIETINPSHLLKIANNKIEMYRHFAQYQPLSAICNTKQDIIKAFKEIPGEKIVVKEPVGQGGKEVYIGEKSAILAELPDVLPVLVQQFMDTSAGIPGYVTGVHDVRLSVCGGTIVGYYIRSAQPGSYHSNVSRGGKMTFFDVSHVPEDLRHTVEAIDRYFGSMPRYYAIDFMHTPDGWKLVELNPYLALIPDTDGQEARKTSAALVAYLVAQTRKIAASHVVAPSQLTLAAQ